MEHSNSRDRWELLSQLFAALLESETPERLLAGIDDPDLRVGAERLWRNHLQASSDGFLGKVPNLGALPVFLPGQLLCGRFRIERLLGAGGMGEVYLAGDEKLGGLIALKTMARMLAPLESIRKRFLAEVQSAKRVTHRNICRIYDLFEDEETVFFTMEYLEGETLDVLLTNADLSPREARLWVRDLAEGLRAAHMGGILHGDLKPGNVIVTGGAGRRAVITDFGLARVVAEPSAAVDRGHSMRAGTAEYMAPEILAGQKPTVASDLFAFGKLASKLLPQARWWRAYTRENCDARPDSLEPALRSLAPGDTRRYWVAAGLAAGGGAVAARVWSITEEAPIPAGSRILVNGVHSEAGLLPQARVIRTLFMIALAQSPRLRTVIDQDLVPALRALNPNGRLPADGDVLKRLVTQSRAAYWIDSNLHETAGRLAWEIKVRRSVDGLTVLQNAVREQMSITSVAEGGALWLRRASGESEESLRKNPATVSKYTSKVPEALDRYAEAAEHISVADLDQAMPLLHEAIRLDPDFAQAHSMLGMCLNSYRRHAEAVESLEAAMRLSARLPELEGSTIAARYYKIVEDPLRMVEAARKNASWQPQDAGAHRQLAHVLCWTGAAERSIEPIRQALEIAPQDDANWSELIVNLCEANRFPEALEVFQQARSQGRTNPLLERGAGLAHMALESYRQAQNCFEAMPGQPGRLVNGAKFMAGSVDVALVGWQQDRASARSEGLVAEEHEFIEFLAAGFSLTDRPVLARQAMVSRPELPLCPPLAKRLQAEIFWSSRLGDTDATAKVVAALAAIAKRWPNGYTTGMQRYGEAVQLRLRGDFAGAEALLVESMGASFSVLTLVEAAEVFAETGKLDVADEYWARFEGRRGTVLKIWFPGYLLYGWDRRMRLARRRNDAAQLRRCAGKILDHWGKALPQLSIVQAARVA